MVVTCRSRRRDCRRNSALDGAAKNAGEPGMLAEIAGIKFTALIVDDP